MVDEITVTDNGTTIDVIWTAAQGPRGATGANGATGAAGAAGADGTPGDTFLGNTVITPVLGSDLIPIVRGTTIYLATVADVLNAQGITPEGTGFDFSESANSGLYSFFF